MVRISHPSVSLVLSSYDDFAQGCAVLTDTQLITTTGGPVSLAAATLSDDFAEPSLDPNRWSAGTWSGGAYTPTLSSGVLTVQDPNGGWVRSKPTYTHGVIEAVAQFGAGTWQHIGFASDGFAGDLWFLFSTFNTTSNLFARVNNGGTKQQVDLGPIPAGFHRYRIEWTALDAGTDHVTFLIDGALAAKLIVSNAGATNLFAYLSNDGPGTLKVDSAQVTSVYKPHGSYTSCALDAGSGLHWQTINWGSTRGASQTLSVQTRTSVDGVTWGPWAAVANGGDSLAAPARYVQFQLLLATGDPLTSPLVNSVTLRAWPDAGA